MINFDSVKTIILPDGGRVDYGFVYGNATIVFIKAGAGGTYTGHEDKYLKMAHMLHEETGCTVICASNPSPDSFEKADAAVLADTAKKIIDASKATVKLCYIGISNGATQGLVVATKLFAFERLMLINMPLMINFHKTKAALARTDADVLFVYGERDASHPYVPFLRDVANRIARKGKTAINVIARADHNFAGMTDDFIALMRKVLEPLPK